jgi:hypothetical protein
MGTDGAHLIGLAAGFHRFSGSRCLFHHRHRQGTGCGNTAGRDTGTFEKGTAVHGRRCECGMRQ